MAIQIRVLHVDDDKLFLATSKELLQEIAKDVSIDIASSVDEALKKVTTEKYDTIISDYDMPIKNGLDFVKHLRENNITTPFILFTGKGREDVAIEALNIGVDHYLNKQGDPEAIYKELAASLRALNEKAKATKLLTQHKGLPIESMPAAIAIIDFNGVVVDGNQNLEKISGFKKEEIIGKSVFTLNFTSQEAFAEIAQNISEVLTGSKCAQPVEYTFKRKDGTLVSVEFSAFPVIRDDDPAILCEINDVTERKKTKDKLKIIFKALPVPTYTWEAIEDDFILIDYNDAALKLTQGLITKYIGITASKMYSRENPVFKDLIECRKARTQFSKQMHYTFQSTSRQRYLDVKYVFVPPNLIIVHTEDISERKEAEYALKESEEKYRMIAENMQDVITVTDRNGNYSYVSPSAEQLFGYKANEMIGKNAFELIHPEEMQSVVIPALPILINGGSLSPVEFRFKIKDESYIWLEGRVSSATEANGNLKFIVVSRDIRARKQAEQAAKDNQRKLEIVNQKLHVVGSLTRHDIANKLSAAKANTYLLKKKLTDHPELMKYLDAIDETVNQSIKIFEFSSIYEKIGAEEPSIVNVSEKFKLAADLLPHNSIEIINDTENLAVLADSMLQQLFYNLIENSIKHGKTVTIIQLNYERDSAQTKLIYQDNGVGIPIENKTKIFSEGFTTGGSGVGLKLVKRMIEVYGWTINEEGEPNKGAKFVITIPRTN